VVLVESLQRVPGRFPVGALIADYEETAIWPHVLRNFCALLRAVTRCSGGCAGIHRPRAMWARSSRATSKRRAARGAGVGRRTHMRRKRRRVARQPGSALRPPRITRSRRRSVSSSPIATW
jgi:hypothetical protein